MTYSASIRTSSTSQTVTIPAAEEEATASITPTTSNGCRPASSMSSSASSAPFGCRIGHHSAPGRRHVWRRDRTRFCDGRPRPAHPKKTERHMPCSQPCDLVGGPARQTQFRLPSFPLDTRCHVAMAGSNRGSMRCSGSWGAKNAAGGGQAWASGPWMAASATTHGGPVDGAAGRRKRPD